MPSRGQHVRPALSELDAAVLRHVCVTTPVRSPPCEAWQLYRHRACSLMRDSNLTVLEPPTFRFSGVGITVRRVPLMFAICANKSIRNTGERRRT